VQRAALHQQNRPAIIYIYIHICQPPPPPAPMHGARSAGPASGACNNMQHNFLLPAPPGASARTGPLRAWPASATRASGFGLRAHCFQTQHRTPNTQHPALNTQGRHRLAPRGWSGVVWCGVGGGEELDSPIPRRNSHSILRDGTGWMHSSAISASLCLKGAYLSPPPPLRVPKAVGKYWRSFCSLFSLPFYSFFALLLLPFITPSLPPLFWGVPGGGRGGGGGVRSTNQLKVTR
jgi:hypothetical protein